MEKKGLGGRRKKEEKGREEGGVLSLVIPHAAPQVAGGFNRFAHTAGPFSSALDFMNESVIWTPMAGGSVAGEFVYGF